MDVAAYNVTDEDQEKTNVWGGGTRQASVIAAGPKCALKDWKPGGSQHAP